MVALAPRLRKNVSRAPISASAHRAVQTDSHGLGQGRIRARENGAAARHFEHTGAAGAAPPGVGRLGGFNPPCQQRIGENHDVIIYVWRYKFSIFRCGE
jgi:hypothetical protein